MSDPTAILAAAEAELHALSPKPFALPLGPITPVVAGGFSGMRKGDWVVTGPRECIGAVLRGCPAQRLKDLHAGARPYKVAPSSAAPGNRALHAVGIAMATGSPVLCFLGLASAASGAFHEALNTVILTGSPVIFLVVVQPIDDDAPVGPQLGTTPSAIGKAWGLHVVEVQANTKAVQKAVAAARKAAKPALIQATLE